MRGFVNVCNGRTYAQKKTQKRERAPGRSLFRKGETVPQGDMGMDMEGWRGVRRQLIRSKRIRKESRRRVSKSWRGKSAELMSGNWSPIADRAPLSDLHPLTSCLGTVWNRAPQNALALPKFFTAQRCPGGGFPPSGGKEGGGRLGQGGNGYRGQWHV